MKKTIGIAAGALLAVAGFVTLTGFGGGCHGRRHGHDPAEVAAFATARVDDALDDVDATPDQRAKIHAVKDRLLAAGQQAHAGNREAHEAVFAEWKSASPDAAKLHALVDARIDAMRAFAHQAVDAGIEVHGILTPEQRAKVTKKVERWHR
ncbi:MAG TPA: Spy/CpxP family protein refolding chaperone [Anaeromyxobacter sp.]